MYLALSRPLNGRTALVGILVPPVLALIGTVQLLALLTSVSFDEHELRWIALWGHRKRFAWSDITNIEVVKKNERASAPEVVLITHARGTDYLPVLIAIPGSWRDPDFEAKVAGLASTWRAATAPAAK
jgi:hypothetical protein